MWHRNNSVARTDTLNNPRKPLKHYRRREVETAEQAGAKRRLFSTTPAETKRQRLFSLSLCPSGLRSNNHRYISVACSPDSADPTRCGHFCCCTNRFLNRAFPVGTWTCTEPVSNRISISFLLQMQKSTPPRVFWGPRSYLDIGASPGSETEQIHYSYPVFDIQTTWICEFKILCKQC